MTTVVEGKIQLGSNTDSEIAKLKSLNKELDQASKPRKVAGSRAAAIADDQADYRTTRGITGQTGAAGRDFAKQAQGLGGLVHLYATFAANIFAVSAAFIALDKAFQYEKMMEGAKVMEASTGVALRSIAANMVKVSDGALSMQESLKFTSLASAAGISSKNIDALTKVAKGAALALGRDMGDSIDRIIRGVAKLEPELVDELGITVKSMQAYKDYAKSLGVTTESLTSYQKTAAYTLAVIKEGTTKFGDIASKVEASPFNKFVGEMKNAGTVLLNLFNNVLTPVLSVFANNIELVFAGILITVKSLAVRAIPELTKMFSVSPTVIKEKSEALSSLLSDIKKNNITEIDLTRDKINTEITLEKQKVKQLKAMELERVQNLVASSVKDPNGKFASSIYESTSISSASKDSGILKGAVAAENRASRALAKAAMTADKEDLEILKGRRDRLREVTNSLKGISTEQAEQVISNGKIKDLVAARVIVDKEGLAVQSAKVSYTKAETDSLKLNLALSKLKRDEAVQEAQYLVGSGQANLVRAQKQLEVEKARTDYAKSRPLLGKIVTEGVSDPMLGPNVQKAKRELTSLGTAYVALGNTMDGLKAKAITLGATISTAMGTLGIIVMVLYALYAATKYVLNSFDMLNKYSGDLSDALKDNENVLHTATAAYTKYSELQKETGYSIRAIIDSNSIAANTFDQVTESINKQIDAFKTWQANQTSLSAWWDQAFGTSNFDKLKQNLANDLQAAAKYSPNMKDNLTKGASEIEAATNIEQLTNIKNKYNQVLFKEAELLKNTNAAYSGLTEGMKTASIAMSTFYKKDEIKNESLRSAITELRKLKDEKDFTIQLKVLAGIEKDSPLYNELPKALQKVVDTQVIIQEQAKAIAAIEKEAADRKLANQSNADNPDNSFDYWMEKQTAYYLQKMKNSLSNLLQNAVDGVETYFSKLGKDFIEAARNISWTSVGKLIFDGLVGAIVLLVPGLKALLPNTGVDYSKARQEGISEADKSKPKSNTEKAKTAAQIAADNARAADIADRAASMAQGEAGHIGRGKAAAQANQTTVNKGLQDTINSLLAKDNKNKQGSGADNAKLALQDQLKLLKAIEGQLSLNNKLEEKHNGYITASNIEELYANKMAQEDVQYAIEKIDVEKAAIAAGKNKLLTVEGIKISENAALQAIEMARDVRVETLKIEKQELLVVQNLKEYQATIGYTLEQELLARQRILEIKTAGNKLSDREILTETNKLKLTELENKLKEANQGPDNVLRTMEQIKKIKEAKDNLTQEQNKQKAEEPIQKLKDELEDLNTKLSTISKIQEIMDLGYPNPVLAKAVLMNKYEGERLKILKEFELDKNNGLPGKREELNIALDLLEVQRKMAEHEANKKAFGSLSNADKAKTVIMEAQKQATDFANSMKDTVTGTFDAVYAGMDAAIDELTTKWMKSEKVSISDLITTFRNTAAEEFRKMAADQMKLGMRNLVKDGITGIADMMGFKVDLSTNEEKAIDYAKRTAEATEAIAQGKTINPSTPKAIAQKAGGGILNTIKGWFGKGDAPDTTGMDPEEATKANIKYFGALEEVSTSIDGISDKTPTMFEGISNSLGDLFDTNGTLMTLLKGVGSGIGGIFGGIMQMFGGSFSGGASSIGGGFGDIIGSISGLFGGSGDAIGSWLGSTLGMEGIGGWLSGLFFANGGIMTEYGAMKLNKYSKGGIANSPQLAMYGEGKTPEAYVPLPDGRSIPVTMDGGSSGGVMINITVNAQTGETQADAKGNDGQNMKQLGSMIANVVKQEIVNQQRSGGLLNKRT